MEAPVSCILVWLALVLDSPPLWVVRCRSAAGSLLASSVAPCTWTPCRTWAWRTPAGWTPLSLTPPTPPREAHPHAVAAAHYPMSYKSRWFCILKELLGFTIEQEHGVV